MFTERYTDNITEMLTHARAIGTRPVFLLLRGLGTRLKWHVLTWPWNSARTRTHTHTCYSTLQTVKLLSPQLTDRCQSQRAWGWGWCSKRFTHPKESHKLHWKVHNYTDSKYPYIVVQHLSLVGQLGCTICHVTEEGVKGRLRMENMTPLMVDWKWNWPGSEIGSI